MHQVIKRTFVASFLLIASGCGTIHVNAHSNQQGQDLDSVFGGVEVGKNSKVGNVSSVNGGIAIDSGATVLSVETVNGGIEIGDDVNIKSAETVNGGIDAGSRLVVKGNLETVNGGIKIKKDGTIGGNVTTVNGDIEISKSKIEKNVKTVNGDVTLTDKTILNGDLVIGTSSSWFSNWNSEKLTIKIDATSQVKGTIHLHKKVELKIDKEASIGKIEKHYLDE